MDHFKQKFLEEASDLIDDLDKILLSVDSDVVERESIEQIFRVMHTIKGSSSMFGFDVIGEFTHNLETIYDLIRNSELSFSKEILDITLASVDHIRKLLTGEINEEVHEELSNNIKKIIGTIQSSTVSKTETVAKEEASVATYYVLFKPEPNILTKGNNPLYLLQDLQDLGETKVIWHLHTIPDFQKINTSECYIYWEIILSCSSSAQDIREVFIFVEDNCELAIEKIANENLFQNPTFVAYLNDIPPKQERVELDKLQVLVKELSVMSTKEMAAQVADKKAPKSIKPGSQEDITVSSIRVSSDKLDNLMNLVSELVTTQARLSLYANNNIAQNELNTIAENIEKFHANCVTILSAFA